MAKIDGIVRFGGVKRGVRMVTVTSLDGQVERKYAVPYGKHILVHDHDRVSAGEENSPKARWCRRTFWPFRARGRCRNTSNEIQEVYRSQGVNINDKHIGVIVRQMLEPGRSIVEARWTPPSSTEQASWKNTLPPRGTRGRSQVATRRAEARPPATSPCSWESPGQSYHQSFISAAASKRPPACSPTRRAIAKKVDVLSGLKENVRMGHLVPAGTGLAVTRRCKSSDRRRRKKLAKDFKISLPKPSEPLEPPEEKASGEVAARESSGRLRLRGGVSRRWVECKRLRNPVGSGRKE